MSTFPRRLEDLECDNTTFPGKNAIWSKDAYDLTLNAWEIPLGTCNRGGTAQPPKTERRIFYVQGLHSESSCFGGFPSWLNSYLQDQQWIKASVNVVGFSKFSYSNSYCDDGSFNPIYTKDDTCGRGDVLGIPGLSLRLKDQIEARAGATKVTVVAHSMGGLITAYLVGSDPDWATQHIASVVTFDSPLRGVPGLSHMSLALANSIPAAGPCDVFDPTVQDMIDLPFHTEPLLQTAANAGNVLPFYTIDSTKNEFLTFEFIPGNRTTVAGTKAQLTTNEKHSEAWSNSSQAKQQFVGCAVLVRSSCTFIGAQTTQGAVTQTFMTIGPPATSFSVTSTFGSVVRMTLVDPSGTRYGPDGDRATAYEVTETSETYVIDNPVTGDWTVELDGIDIPLGTEPVDLLLSIVSPELSPPSADAGGPYEVEAQTSALLDASASSDDGLIQSYEWDWDNDGHYDESTADPTIAHVFGAAYEGQISVRVTDGDGLSDVAFADIRVTEPPTPTPTSTATNTPTATATSTPTLPATRTIAPTRTVVRTATQVPAKCADVNGDHRVTLADLFLVLGHVGRPYKAKFDLNNDRRVDLRDVIIVWRQLGRRC